MGGEERKVLGLYPSAILRRIHLTSTHANTATQQKKKELCWGTEGSVCSIHNGSLTLALLIFLKTRNEIRYESQVRIEDR